MSMSIHGLKGFVVKCNNVVFYFFVLQRLEQNLSTLTQISLIFKALPELTFWVAFSHFMIQCFINAKVCCFV